MSRIEHKLGLTEPLKRLAFFYVKKGLGRHASIHEGYDSVVVRELYSWNAPAPDMPPQGGIVVEFHVAGRRVRWVEFACRFVGGGGEPIVREV